MVGTNTEIDDDAAPNWSMIVAAPLVCSVRTLAITLECSEKTVRRLDEDGMIPAPITIGSLRRWRREELVDWLRTGAPSRDEWEADR